jgi:hypothetical protein
MKTITPIDLIKMNNEELYSIIESYIDDFEINTVIQTLAELNYRGYQPSIFIIEKYEKFLVKNNFDSLETAINNYLFNNGFSTYLDYRKSLIENNISEFVVTNPVQISKAGKPLKKIGTYMVLNICSIIIGLLIVISADDLDTITNTYIFFGLCTLVFNILIIINFYEAGNSLEQSVYFKANESTPNEINDKDSEIKENIKPSF